MRISFSYIFVHFLCFSPNKQDEKDDTSTQPEYSFEKAYDINWGEVGVAIAAVAVVFVAVVGSYGTAAPAAAAMLSVAANLAYAYN